ncbi:BnaC02g42070D [Brassica napus]|uniref:BnaC02g42070D protein n=1 Tax=Brassica napus TaxID=3708 RepID=A0A078IA79_BRANA|nr:BnaC02g42070D [Brassica napus]
MVNQMTSSVQQAISSTDVRLTHVPSGVKDGSDKKILVDMLLWAMQNRAPSNLMLISGDGDYSYVLHRLRMLGYNVLLVRPENVSCFLIAAVNTIWLWRSIVAGGSGAEIPKQATRKRMKSDLVVKSKSRKRLCETCNVTCISVVDYNSHLSSKKHKKKVKLCLFSGLLELT